MANLVKTFDDPYPYFRGMIAETREALKLSSGAWNPENHPELADGGAAYVEKIRSEPDERFEAAVRRNHAP